MKIVKFTDDKGYLRCAMIKDEDPDIMAKYGVPVEIPDIVNTIDWDGLKRDLHNALMQANLYTVQDVMKSGQAYAPAMTVIKRYLHEAYMAEALSETTQENSSGG